MMMRTDTRGRVCLVKQGFRLERKWVCGFARLGGLGGGVGGGVWAARGVMRGVTIRFGCWWGKA